MSKKKKKDLEKSCQCDETCTCGCNEGNECQSECCKEECKCDNTELDKLKESVKTLQEALLREKAEVQNYKRRKDEEISKTLKYANEDMILEFLPILDNLERAIKLDDNNLDDEVSKFLSGIKMVYTQIKNMLEKYEVKEIDTLGKPFNPTYHQAVLTDKVDHKEPGIVLEVYQKGYMYKDKVIRVSMVKVNE
mgnify:CR=1 FL=1